MGNRRYPVKLQSIQKLNAKLLYVSTSKYEEDWPSLPHTHPFTELFYVVKGGGVFYLDGKTFPITVNDLVIVASNVEHTEESLGGTPLEYIALGIDGLSFLDTAYSIGKARYNYQNRQEILSIIHMLLQEVREEQYGYELVCQNLLETLLIHIIRWQRLIPAAISSAAITKECDQVRRYIDAHYSENLSLEQLAIFSHMNKFYLVHAFTKLTGQSPIQYVKNKRLEIGRELLERTNHSISEIASSIGFSSQSYFAQAFKKSMGISPSRYRERHAGNSVKTDLPKPMKGIIL